MKIDGLAIILHLKIKIIPFSSLQNQKRGSFLARSKEALAKIAEMTKPVANPSAGAKSSGKFTFAVISPDKENSHQVMLIYKKHAIEKLKTV